MLSPRLRATSIGGSPTDFQQEPSQVSLEIGSSIQGQTLESSQRLIGNLVKSNNQNAQVSAQRAEAEALAAQGLINKVIPPGGSPDGLSGLAAGIADLGKFYLAYKQQEQEKLNQEAWKRANDEVEPLTTAAPEIVRSDGYQQYRQQSLELVRRYEPYLKPDQYVELVRRLEDPAQQVLGSMGEERRQFLTKQANQQEESEIQMALMSLEYSRVAIQKAKDPEDLEAQTKLYYSKLDEIIEKSSPEVQQRIISEALKSVRDASGGRVGELLDLRNRLENLQEYTQETLKDWSMLKDQGPGYLPQYLANQARRKERYGVSSNLGDDPYVADKAYLDMVTRQTSIEEAVASGDSDVIEAAEVTRDEAVAFAAMFYADPRKRKEFEKYLKNPTIASAVELADSMKKYDEKVYELTTKKAKFEAELRAMDVMDLKQWLSWVGSDQGQETLQNLGIETRYKVIAEKLLQTPVKKGTGAQAKIVNLGDLLPSQQGTVFDRVGGLDDLLSTPEIQEEVSPDEIQAVRLQIQNLRAQMKQDVVGEVANLFNDPEYVRLRNVLHSYKLLEPKQREAQSKVASQRVTNALERIRKKQEERRSSILPQNRPGGGGAESPFNLPPLKEAEVGGQKILLPFRPDAPVSVSDVYGYRPNRGRNHAGLDIAAPVGTPIVFYDEGEVIFVEPSGDYGNLIDVRTPDGLIHRFAHLQGSYVKVGQKVRPGNIIGKTGNTGRSTGPHLHWEVRTSEQGYFDGSTDPVVYASKLRQGRGKQVRNGQSQPTSVPSGSVRLRGGSYIKGNKIYNPDGSTSPVGYTPGNPMREDFASPYAKDYKPAPLTANYGYAHLARNIRFTKKLNQTAKAIGIPGQWLADIIAFESQFNPGAVNRSSGATGLIQFMPETARALGTSVEALRKMSAEQQLVYVKKYFDMSGFSGNIKNVYAALAAVFSTPDVFRRANAEEPISVSDGFTTFDRYVNELLGSPAGRRYKPYGKKRASVTHTKYSQGCPVCDSIIASGSDLFPHKFS